MCELRKKVHLQKDYTPSGNPSTIAKGVYYLTSVDNMFRRKYEIQA
jgi:hydroxymethylglutaryl-CoA synthase